MKIFEILYFVLVLLDKDKIVVIKVDRDLLRWVVVVLEFGCEVDVDIFL